MLISIVIVLVCILFISVEQVYEYILLFLSKYTGILIDLITSTSTYCTAQCTDLEVLLLLSLKLDKKIIDRKKDIKT